MKTCSYCGKEHSDEATVCSLDGQPLDVVTPQAKVKSEIPDSVDSGIHPKRRRRLLAIFLVAAIALIGFSIWPTRSATIDEIVAAVSTNGGSILGVNIGEQSREHLLTQGKWPITARKRVDRLSGRTLGYETWRNPDDLKAGSSEWLSGDIIESRDGLFVMEEQGTPARARPLVLHFPPEIQAAVQSGKWGLIQANVVTQYWRAMPKGTPVQAQVENASGTVREDLASLRLMIQITNTSSSTLRFTPDLQLAGNGHVRLQAFHTDESYDKQPKAREVLLSPHSVTNLSLETAFHSHDDLRRHEPLSVVSLGHGWKLSVERVPNDVRSLLQK